METFHHASFIGADGGEADDATIREMGVTDSPSAPSPHPPPPPPPGAHTPACVVELVFDKEEGTERRISDVYCD